MRLEELALDSPSLSEISMFSFTRCLPELVLASAEWRKLELATQSEPSAIGSQSMSRTAVPDFISVALFPLEPIAMLSSIISITSFCIWIATSWLCKSGSSLEPNGCPFSFFFPLLLTEGEPVVSGTRFGSVLASSDRDPAKGSSDDRTRSVSDGD